MKTIKPPPAFGHLREAYPKGAPKYDIKSFYAHQTSVVVFGVPKGMLREGREGAGRPYLRAGVICCTL